MSVQIFQMHNDTQSDLVKEVLLTQGDPEAPQCGFSNMACRILDAYSALLFLSHLFFSSRQDLRPSYNCKQCIQAEAYLLNDLHNCYLSVRGDAGVQYGSRNVLIDPELREEIKKFSQWPTIPQVISFHTHFYGWNSAIKLNRYRTCSSAKWR